MWYDVTLKMCYDSLYLQMQEDELEKLKAEWASFKTGRAEADAIRRYDGRAEDTIETVTEDGKVDWKDQMFPCHILVDLYEVVAIKATVAAGQGEQP